MTSTVKVPTVLPPEEKKVLNAKEEKRLDELTQGLKVKLSETLKNMFSIGKDFLEMKALLDHGDFKPYVEANFDMSYRTAARFMNVAEHLTAHMNEVAQLSQRALYLLASDSVEDQREELIKLVKKGKIKSYDDIMDHLHEPEPGEETPKPIRIKSFAKGFGRFYSQASHGLQDFSGKITKSHQVELRQVQAQLHELDGLIGSLLKKAEEDQPKKPGRKKKTESEK